MPTNIAQNWIFWLLFMVTITPAAYALEMPAPGAITQTISVEPVRDDDDLDIKLPGMEPQADDPWEDFNRPVFGFNKTLDTYFLRPVASGYRWALPETIRDGIGNFFENLGEPVGCINGVLQFDRDKTFRPFWRFIFNTTLGVGGVYDFAGKYTDLPHKKNTFGDTLESYGLGSGPYLVMPLFGPSNPRDAVGDIVDYAMNPFNWIALTPIDNELTGLEVIDQRDQNAVLLDELYNNSPEPYIAMRSAYLQNKTFASRDGKIKKLDD